MSGRRRRSLCPCLEASRLPRTFLSHVRSVARQMSLNHEINKLAHFRVSLHSAESFARKSSQLCMVRVASLWRLRCRSGIIFEQCLLSKQREVPERLVKWDCAAKTKVRPSPETRQSLPYPQDKVYEGLCLSAPSEGPVRCLYRAGVAEYRNTYKYNILHPRRNMFWRQSFINVCLNK